MPKHKERKANEDYLINKFHEDGWNYKLGKELERDSYEDPILNKRLEESLRRINEKKGIELGEEDIKKVSNELKLRGTGQEAHKKILEFLKKGVSIKLQKNKQLTRIKIFDYENLDNNDFLVTNQPAYHSAQNEIYPDIVLYVNGIPLVIIECKDSGNPSENWETAFKQIVDYQKKVPEIFKYVQIGVAAASVAKYFPIVPWKGDNVKVYEWKDESKKDILKDISMVSIIEMLSKNNILEIIKNYLFFREEEQENTKVITRYMQKRAVDKIFNRVVERIEGNDDKDRGLIWHWQGSGKTLTMIFAANKLYNLSKLENPTIFFILDRRGLENQLNEEFNSLGLSPGIVPITSIKELKEVLRADGGRGKRGYFSILVHKFRQEELKDLQKELEDLGEERETVTNRRNIISFVDESHRTQYGLLSAQMKAILKKAFFFAFTGTPIAKKQKNTYDEFAYPEDKEYYLDKYFLTDSINDGFTVKITYEPRLEKDVHLKKDELRDLLEIEDEELPEERKDEIKERAKKKINFKKAYYENKERIEKIAKDISEHFKEYVEGRFKGMVVTGSRKACIKYKQELDKYLEEGNSEIVMTFNEKDDSEIKNYLEKLEERYPNKSPKEIREKIIENFKKKSKPKILIVTDMLLTGFDAPILQTMYLDKPLKEHRLLQAVARTNRPYKGVKEAGKIIDYLGILKDFYKAFEIYSEEKIKKDMQEALVDKEKIRKEFDSLLKETLEIFEGIDKEYNRDYLVKALEILSDENKSEKFLKNYKELRKKFELLGADPKKVSYADDFAWLSWIYINYQKQTTQSDNYEDQELVKKYFRKTLKFIHKATKIDDPKSNLPTIDFDENYINKIHEKYKTKEEKAANIIFTLNRYVLVDKKKNPAYQDLVEKVKKLMEEWKEKTKDFEKIYREGLEVLNKRNEMLERKRKLGFDETQYFVLKLLEDRAGGNQEEKTKKIFEKLENENYFYTNWQNQTTTVKKMGSEVRKFLIKNYVNKEMIEYEEVDDLTEKIMDVLKNGKRG